MKNVFESFNRTSLSSHTAPVARILAVVVLLTLPLASWAGNEVPNGGDGLVCERTGEGKTVELLDYFEGTNHHKVPESPVFGPDGLQAMDYVHIVLDRLERLDPDRAAAYRQMAMTFLEEASIEYGHLVDIPDSNHVRVPAQCKIEQLAVHQEPIAGEPRYMIDKHHFDQMPPRHQAGLILHEIIYREAIALGHKDSRRVRYFNSWIASKAIETMSLESYVKVVHNSQLTATRTINGLTYELRGLDFYPNGQLKRGRLVGLMKWRINNPFVSGGIPILGGILQFHQSGGILELDSTFVVPFKNLPNKCRQDAVGRIVFHENGVPASFDVPDGLVIMPGSGVGTGQKVQVPMQSQKGAVCQDILVPPSSQIMLYDNGTPRSITLGQDAQIQFSDGKWKTVKTGETVRFEPSGLALPPTP